MHTSCGRRRSIRDILRECVQTELIESVVGLVDDDKKKLGMHVVGKKKVIGKLKDIKRLVHAHKINILLISIESLSARKMHAIANAVDVKKVAVKIIPSNREKLREEISLYSMRDLIAEDLIGRKVTPLNNELIEKKIAGTIIFITGAGGSIGSEIAYQLLRLPIKKMVCLCRSEYSLYQLQERIAKENQQHTPVEYYLGNIRDYDRMEEIIIGEKPDFIFHAAAHKHLPYMEKNEKEAIKNNVFGTENLLKLVHVHGVKRFILISTDKAVNPSNVMGATKRIAELLTHYFYQKYRSNVAVVRFGNVIGSRGSVMPLFRKQIENGGPITVTHRDVVRFFMTSNEAALLVINAAILFNEKDNIYGQTFILEMGEPVNIDKLVRCMARLHGLEVGRDIDIVYTGLRQGEKKQEELLTAQENLKKTENAKIYVLAEQHHDIKTINQWVQSMKKIITSLDRERNKATVR